MADRIPPTSGPPPSEAPRYPKSLFMYVFLVFLLLMPALVMLYILSGGTHGTPMFGINPTYYALILGAAVFIVPWWIIQKDKAKQASK